MLDPWIIEEIRRREEDKRRQEERGLELPLESPHYRDREPQKPTPEKDERGVTIIDI